jgi:hypothetical protein
MAHENYRLAHACFDAARVGFDDRVSPALQLARHLVEGFVPHVLRVFLRERAFRYA